MLSTFSDIPTTESEYFFKLLPNSGNCSEKDDKSFPPAKNSIIPPVLGSACASFANACAAVADEETLVEFIPSIESEYAFKFFPNSGN